MKKKKITHVHLCTHKWGKKTIYIFACNGTKNKMIRTINRTYEQNIYVRVWYTQKKKKTKKLNGTGKTETKRNKKTKKLKRKTENEKADGDYAGERSGNGRVGWRSVRSAGNCGSRRTSERQYSKHRTRQEADARLQ